MTPETERTIDDIRDIARQEGENIALLKVTRWAIKYANEIGPQAMRELHDDLIGVSP